MDRRSSWYRGEFCRGWRQLSSLLRDGIVITASATSLRELSFRSRALATLVLKTDAAWSIFAGARFACRVGRLRRVHENDFFALGIKRQYPCLRMSLVE